LLLNNPVDESNKSLNVDIPETKLKRNIHSKGLLNTDKKARDKYKRDRVKSLEFEQMKIDIKALQETVKALLIKTKSSEDILRY